MDNYPKHLAPKNADDLNQEPFADWWRRVRSHYPYLPENVAEQWLHRHWHYSPFEWIPSSKVRFQLQKWPVNQLTSIQANTMKGETYSQWGKRLCKFDDPNRIGTCWVAAYMHKNRTWPHPPIILEKPDIKLDKKFDTLPSGYYLIEGHKRFAIASHLIKIGRIEPELDVWVMTVIKD